MDWKLFADKMQAKTYVLPAGWDTQSEVAEKLGCSTDKVRVLLAPGIKNGAVETAAFPVWDRLTRRIVRTTAYRQTGGETPVKKALRSPESEKRYQRRLRQEAREKAAKKR